MDAGNKNQTVYLETSVISYYTNKISTVIKIAGEQQITREWWEQVLPNMKPFISDYVLREIGGGAPREASTRREAVASFEVLKETPLVVELASIYLKKLPIPKKAELDAFHLAIAAAYNIDFLVSWNCKHIANAFMTRPIQKINASLGVTTPVICVPTAMTEN